MKNKFLLCLCVLLIFIGCFENQININNLENDIVECEPGDVFEPGNQCITYKDVTGSVGTFIVTSDGNAKYVLDLEGHYTWQFLMDKLIISDTEIPQPSYNVESNQFEVYWSPSYFDINDDPAIWFVASQLTDGKWEILRSDSNYQQISIEKHKEASKWTASNEGYIVRVIYLKPNDINNPDIDGIRKIAMDVQEAYRSEMNRHGYGNKTFKFEKNDEDKINVNVINGKNHSLFYFFDTKERIYDELTENQYKDFTDEKYIHVFIVGGVRRVVNGILGRGKPFPNSGFGGICILAEDSEVGLFNLMCHEIGHAFSLYHTTNPNRMMNTRSFNAVLSHYEARWLNKHYFFNDDIEIDIDLSDIKVLKIIEKDIGVISVDFNITSPDELYQIVVRDEQTTEVVGHSYIHGHNIDVTIELEKDKLVNNYIICMIMNVTGSYVHYRFSLNI